MTQSQGRHTMMTRTKTKLVAATVAGVLLCSGATCFIVTKLALRRALEADRNAPPFKFSHHFDSSPTTSPASASAASAAGGDRGLADFTSNIPVIVLRSESPDPVSNDRRYSEFTMMVYEPKENRPVRLDQAPSVSSRVGLRRHGMVSRQFPKLSYRLKLQDESGASRGRALLGMPADADWVLQGPWLDKSLIRNAFSYDLARAMGCAAMRTRVCELFLGKSGQPITEADYVGIYQVTEDIERGEQRVPLAKLAPEDNVEPAISGGYLLAWDVGNGTYLHKWKSIQVKYPKHPSRAQMEWIDRTFTQFDAALKSPDATDPEHGYAAYIEVGDWINYVLFEELVFNLDGYTRSFYMHKERGGKIRPGPVWDHDLGLGHQFPNGTSFRQWWFTQAGRHGWISRLMDDPAFVQRMAQRWRNLRQGVLSDAQIEARIDTFAAPLLSGAADRNFDRWKILNVQSPFTPSQYITIATATYPEQIIALKRFLSQRAAWMDEHLRPAR
jgi:hypothetical protein